MQYEELQAEFEDVAFTTPTPFDHGGGGVRHDELAANLDYLEDAGAGLYVPCGNTGEYDALSDDERAAVVRTHVETVADDATVVGGLGGSLPEVRSLADRYADAGADAVMVMDPDHTYAHERGLVEYYRRIAAATDLGVVVYARSDRITPDVLESVVSVENVVAVKYAVADVPTFSRLADATEGEVTWVNGLAEGHALAFGVEGAGGYTTGVGNFAPEITLDLFDAVRGGDWDRARRLRGRFRPLEELRDETGTDNALAAANNVPVVKYGLELAGLYGGPVRPPLVGLSARDRDRVREYCATLGVAD